MQEPIATVINNNQPGWTNIIETAPNVTLDVGTKLYAAPPFVETGWVLERADTSAAAPLYYAPTERHSTQWTTEPDKALRLARCEDAEQLAGAIGVEVRVAEHQWS